MADWTESDEVAAVMPLPGNTRLTETEAQRIVRGQMGGPETVGYQVFHNAVESVLMRANR